ncbi:copper ion binding protein [Lipingzhangella halophila]|uniref:Copper ion binding protein n=1 Tax=Lipingzhangella halophila TaxID=1783352 RepID=A0A7W7RKR2_9ACTN|nr:heavy-metal-associated domain-containing protein [Lipingzhangella halophila]MBB4933368.1 copper ion binding protein [Lipingzhangella halophila]
MADVDDGNNTPVTARYTVSGMSCEHCVKSVTEEVGEVAGVTGVDVDLASGLLSVTSDGRAGDAAIRAAVEEAGYAVEGR